MTTSEEVLKFWFEDHGSEDWFMGGDEFDAKCHAELGEIHAKAVKGELWAWRTSARGRLAEIILLDQLSRQLHRGSAKAFASDTTALVLAQEMISAGLDKELSVNERAFVYLPFEHSESLHNQTMSVKLFAALGDENFLQYANDHRDIIGKFGRFPMRNAALGREATPEEAAYIADRDGKAF